jgi:hypothetical protein
MLDARRLVETHNVLFVTLDTLRFDVAEAALLAGGTPNLARLLPGGVWEKRHTPGNFTYAAHQAFFAGFLPTPASPGPHPRLFAAKFPGSETTCDETCLFETPDIVTGLAALGFHTICIGGVGFFNKQSELGNVLPNLFHESHWNESLGVTCYDSTQNQVRQAVSSIREVGDDRRVFLFLNVSALHQPNCGYVTDASSDSPATQQAALEYVDTQLPALFEEMARQRPVLCVICSDHGTAYGEDGFIGHRLAHPAVWEVPYAEFVIDQTTASHS